MDNQKDEQQKHENPDISPEEDAALDAAWDRLYGDNSLSEKAKEVLRKAKQKKV